MTLTMTERPRPQRGLPETPAGIEGMPGRLRAARTLRGLSQRDLEVSGVTAAYICRIEAGTRTPSVPAIRALAEALNVSPVWLETGVDERWQHFAAAELAVLGAALERAGGAATARLRDEIEQALELRRSTD